MPGSFFLRPSAHRGDGDVSAFDAPDDGPTGFLVEEIGAPEYLDDVDSAFEGAGQLTNSLDEHRAGTVALVL